MVDFIFKPMAEIYYHACVWSNKNICHFGQRHSFTFRQKYLLKKFDFLVSGRWCGLYGTEVVYFVIGKHQTSNN